MSPIKFPVAETVTVDPYLWKACAGTNVRVPEVGTDVYYFPEGHAEQCDSDQAAAPIIRPMVLCRVLEVRFLADREKDGVFAKIKLQPMGCEFRRAAPESMLVDFGGGVSAGVEREGSRIVSYKKILTQSDANCGGGFTVPKPCAVAIFPPLKYENDLPVQNLTIADVQGRDWVFRHIYRGTPERHLLTSGWTKFVNNKKLVAGDTVVFMKDNLTGKLYIGIRRLARGRGWRNRRRSLNLGEGEGTGGLARFVEEAAMKAAQGSPFEVILYPGNGLPDFLVNADLVDRALSQRWAVGIRVKIAVAAEDSIGPSCLQGHVSMIMISQDCGIWRGSPWKMLQITWVEPKLQRNVERLSPWQVEYVEDGELLLPIHPPISVRDPHIIQPLTERSWERYSTMRQEPHSTMAQGEPWSAPHTRNLFNPNTHLASMQGARHLSDASDLIGGDTHQMQNDDTSQMSNMSLLRSRITEVTPGGGNKSFQLFGITICVENPVENQSDNVGRLETASNKGDDEAESVENHQTAPAKRKG